jgi:hypothetical protein
VQVGALVELGLLARRLPSPLRSGMAASSEGEPRQHASPPRLRSVSDPVVLPPKQRPQNRTQPSCGWCHDRISHSLSMAYRPAKIDIRVQISQGVSQRQFLHRADIP